MAQYAVDPLILAPWLPPGVEIDLFQGASGPAQCFVSLIGFLFTRVRLKGIPIPFHTTFEEVNLRFYVRRTEADGSVKRGVVFIRELVPRHAITFIANTLYEEPYATCATGRRISETPDTLAVQYSWKHRGLRHSLEVTAHPRPQPVLPGSVEDFITEHYWGFTRRSRGATSQYQVEHPRWETYPIRSHDIHVDFAALYGPVFAHLNHQQPAGILLAEGSPVAVYSGTRLVPDKLSGCPNPEDAPSSRNSISPAGS